MNEGKTHGLGYGTEPLELLFETVIVDAPGEASTPVLACKEKPDVFPLVRPCARSPAF